MSPSLLQNIPLVLLGTGYTGRRLYHQACEAGWNVFTTSRMPDIHLSDISPQHRIHFDLTQPETWRTIPTPAHLIWCFPATPLNVVRKFFAGRPRKPGRILVMGSTSAYGTNCGTITEQTPVNMDIPRVQGEEYLRTQLGGVVIRLAGLYGPGRHVLDWMRKGRIRNTAKWVNLLHVEDAAGICLRALERAQNGTTYLASDGTPRTWSEIFSMASEKWGMPLPPPTPLREIGKQVSIHKLLTNLHYTLRYPDLYQALDDIERHSSLSTPSTPNRHIIT